MKILRPEGDGVIGIAEAPEPLPGAGEVVVETVVSALCGSELHSYRGPGSKTGNSGHEGVGRIAKLGEGVTGLQVGQRVGVSAVAGCGRCPQCAERRYTWCSKNRVYTNMHAERFLAAAGACYALPADLAWDAAVLITGDGLGTPYHTSTKITSPDIETVAVFGVGPIGLGNVLVQSHFGRRVIAIDVSASRLSKAAELGAAETVDGSDGGAVEKVLALTGGAGADACIEAAGREATALECFAAVRTAGTVVFDGEQGPVPLSPSAQFIRRDITAVGSWFYHFCEIDTMLGLYRDGLPVLDLVSHRFPYGEADEAYRQFAAGRTAKVLLEWKPGD